MRTKGWAVFFGLLSQLSTLNSAWMTITSPIIPRLTHSSWLLIQKPPWDIVRNFSWITFWVVLSAVKIWANMSERCSCDYPWYLDHQICSCHKSKQSFMETCTWCVVRERIFRSESTLLPLFGSRSDQALHNKVRVTSASTSTLCTCRVIDAWKANADEDPRQTLLVTRSQKLVQTCEPHLVQIQLHRRFAFAVAFSPGLRQIAPNRWEFLRDRFLRVTFWFGDVKNRECWLNQCQCTRWYLKRRKMSGATVTAAVAKESIKLCTAIIIYFCSTLLQREHSEPLNVYIRKTW